MANDKPLAHSPRQGIPAQTYFEHVANVSREALCNARRAKLFYTGDRQAFVSWIEAAALYHDLGKLDNANQVILQKQSRKPLPISHDDAGVAELDKLGRQEAVVLAYGHHEGLFSRDNELAKQGRLFRQLKRTTPGGEKVADHVDCELESYEDLHFAAGCPTMTQVVRSDLHKCGFTRRIALSCLVDADHGDTARHYGNEVEIPEIEPRWKDRFFALQHYVDQLAAGNTERQRNHLRKRLFETCREAPLDPSIRTCDAPVGSGKTTAVMAHLLRVASERRPELRHIIVVLPYTNIINQSVETYRKSLVLDGERPEDVVVEHHHRADFADLELRQLATLWKAPIVVTTAVQFFETIASSHPAQLRKLHELPGSAVFIDEMHAAIPSHLWPQMWRWLETWTREWGGHLVMASGSLPRFWELPEYKDIILGNNPRSIPEVPDLVSDLSFRCELKEKEKRRISYHRRPEKAGSCALDCLGVIEFIQEKPGPRLLIVNTVQTAAVIAKTMHKSGLDVLHLSTAFAPAHRDLIVERIKRRLLKRGMEDWTLVATSCVEAGMDFSFRTGFRERSSTASLIQVGGRVSRSDEYENAEVWDILFLDNLLPSNPSLSISRQALDCFTLQELNQMHPAELAALAMRREWTYGADEKARQIIGDEDRLEYPKVSAQCRVIETDTRTVIIDKSLAEAVRNGQQVSRHELMMYSVQIWAAKINNLALQPAVRGCRSEESNIYVWHYDYDPEFLGYMKGVLKLEEFIASGGAVV